MFSEYTSLEALYNQKFKTIYTYNNYKILLGKSFEVIL